MSRQLVGLAVVLALGGVSLGCQTPTDLGRTCTLRKKDPLDPTKTVIIKEGEIRSLVGTGDSQKDFLSFGVAECEDLVCVRDAKVIWRGDAEDALGYCSRPCSQNSVLGCPAENPADDKDPLLSLSCRSMLMDEASLAALRQSNPAEYRKLFGDTTSPYFCARGGASTTDGGR